MAVLGPVGRNFAAGMSGGIAYVYDPDNTLKDKLAEGSFIVTKVKPESLADSAVPLHEGKSDEAVLRSLLTEHVQRTGSIRAQQILDNFAQELPRFTKIFPQEYYRALMQLTKEA